MNWSKSKDEDRRHRKLVELLEPREGDFILDCGCGYGKVAVMCRDRGAEVVGYDKKILTDKIPIIKGNITSIPFKDDTFNKVCLSEVIEHVSKDDGIKTLLEIRRIMKKGGKLVLTTPNKWHILFRILLYIRKKGEVEVRSYHEHVHEYSFNELRKVLHDTEFRGYVDSKGVFGHLWAVVEKK